MNNECSDFRRTAVIPAAPVPRDRNMVVIATHDGIFHADDILGVAVLKALVPETPAGSLGFADISIIRTRNPEEWERANFLVDVGGEWNPEAGRFDHHQKGFEGARPEGARFATAGLVWAQYGQAFVSKFAPELSDTEVVEAAAYIDEVLIQYVDQVDTGEAQPCKGHYGLTMLLDSLNPTFSELNAVGHPDPFRDTCNKYALQRRRFLEAVDITGTFLQREVVQAAAMLQGKAKVRSAGKHFNGRILELPEPGLAWSDIVCNEMPEVLFVVFPEGASGTVMLQAVPVECDSFISRKLLPESWSGLRGKDLGEVTGVTGTVFCHTARFIAGSATLESALKLAGMAVENVGGNDKGRTV